jgi:hypothetical protein
LQEAHTEAIIKIKKEKQEMKKKLLAGLALTCFTALLSAQVATANTFQGTTTGTFVNPDAGINTGVGTAHFTTGTGTPTELYFSGNPAIDVNSDTTFSFGTLTYYNGATYSGSTASTVDLDVTVNLTSPIGIIEDFLYNLTFNMTPNEGSPEEQADYLYLPTIQPSTSFSYDGTDYTLEFLGFGSIDSNGFVTSLDQFHVYEGASASAQLFGKFTESTAPAPVPEPASILLFGTGITGLVGSRLRRKKKA